METVSSRIYGKGLTQGRVEMCSQHLKNAGTRGSGTVPPEIAAFPLKMLLFCLPQRAVLCVNGKVSP